MPVNQLWIQAPLLEGQDPGNFAIYHTVGECLDPFVSMINHSCGPNVWWIYEGKELRIRARRSISTGDELFVNYQGGMESFTTFATRSALLEERWGFVCTCTLCQEGDLNPTGTLARDVSDFLERTPDLSPKAAVTGLADVKRLMERMKSAGFGLDIWPMRNLYMMARSYYRSFGMDAEYMKASLELAITIPPAELEPRLDDMFMLNFAMDEALAASPSAKLDQESRRNLEIISWHLKARYVRELEKWFGEDSMVANHARNLFAVSNRPVAEVAYEPAHHEMRGER